MLKVNRRGQRIYLVSRRTEICDFENFKIQFKKLFVSPSLIEYPLREGPHSSLFRKSGKICFFSIWLSKPTGLPSAVTWWCLELEQLKWARGVFVSRVQCSGTRFRSKFDFMNKLCRRGATRGVLGGARAPPDLFRVGPAIFANPLSFHFLTMGGYPW